MASGTGGARGWGMKCGQGVRDRRAPEETSAARAALPRSHAAPLGQGPLYAEAAAGCPGAVDARRVRIGLPRALYGVSLYPLWRRFLPGWGSGGGQPNQRADALEQGTALVNSDFCAPMILAHGLREAARSTAGSTTSSSRR